MRKLTLKVLVVMVLGAFAFVGLKGQGWATDGDAPCVNEETCQIVDIDCCWLD